MARRLSTFLLDDGNDRLTFDASSFGRVTAHGGAGDDVITNITVGNGYGWGRGLRRCGQ